MVRSTLFVVALCSFCVRIPCFAMPVLLSEAEFQSLSVGLAATTEDFESYPSNVNIGNPFFYSGGRVSVSAVNAGAIPFVEDEARFCGVTGQCLGHSGTRLEFGGFPENTAIWKANVNKGAINQIVSTFTVDGGSGTLFIRSFNPQPFVAVYDPLGIDSIKVEQFGGTFVMWDNITVLSIPEPSGAVLLLVGCYLLCPRRKAHVTPQGTKGVPARSY